MPPTNQKRKKRARDESLVEQQELVPRKRSASSASSTQQATDSDSQEKIIQNLQNRNAELEAELKEVKEAQAKQQLASGNTEGEEDLDGQLRLVYAELESCHRRVAELEAKRLDTNITHNKHPGISHSELSADNDMNSTLRVVAKRKPGMCLLVVTCSHSYVYDNIE